MNEKKSLLKEYEERLAKKDTEIKEMRHTVEDRNRVHLE